MESVWVCGGGVGDIGETKEVNGSNSMSEKTAQETRLQKTKEDEGEVKWGNPVVADKFARRKNKPEERANTATRFINHFVHEANAQARQSKQRCPPSF